MLVYPVITLVGGAGHRGSRNNLLGAEASEELAAEWSTDQRITDKTPPTFLVHASDDEGVLAIELQLTALEATDGRQLQLFAQMEDRYRLAEALDRLAHKHPGDSVLQAQPHLPDDELVAERYRLRRR